MQPSSESNRDLVLVGGGHSHLAILRQLGMRPVPGLRVSVISKDVMTPYSGMLPGLIAGHYREEQCFIDLRRLCQWAGIRLFHSAATRIDTALQQVHCDNRPPVRYDWLSVNAGSTPDISAIEGADTYAVRVKPIDHFLSTLKQLLERLPHNGTPACLTLVGGGAASVELALALQHRIAANGGPGGIRLQLLSAEQTLLPGHNRRVARYLCGVLQSRGIELMLDHRVQRIDQRYVYCSNDTRLSSDFTVIATHAAPPAWLADSGLSLDPAGFVLVTDTLQSVSHNNVFAAGDCARIDGTPLPRSGVYAVRQGPVLADNLRRCISGQALRKYRPQHRFLALLATGDRNAVASRGRLFAAGPWIWRWKSRIDQRFMQRFNRLPAMPADEPEAAAAAVRCGGCGAKIGGQSLRQVLSKLDAGDESALADNIEDAALITPPANCQMVQTLDHFRAFIDDPYLVGRIGANHCLGDIYAMGAKPDSALALANIPYGHPRIMEETLYQLMRGALDTLREAETTLLGGHSSEAAELAFGLTVNGHVPPGQALLKGGLQSGQLLVLGKPLGTGTLLAANMRYAARGNWIDGALATMQQSNAGAAIIMLRYGTTACTDVTGFGLLGHLLEMLRAARLDATLYLEAIPTLPGALQCMEKSIFSTLHPDNATYGAALTNESTCGRNGKLQILFDPQTAGGLLCGIAQAEADDCISELRQAGYEAAVIGRVDHASTDPAVTLA